MAGAVKRLRNSGVDEEGWVRTESVQANGGTGVREEKKKFGEKLR